MIVMMMVMMMTMMMIGVYASDVSGAFDRVSADRLLQKLSQAVSRPSDPFKSITGRHMIVMQQDLRAFEPGFLNPSKQRKPIQRPLSIERPTKGPTERRNTEAYRGPYREAIERPTAGFPSE